MRQIPALPLGMPRVHYLRTEAHADALAHELKAARHLAVVGGGLIGLEVAASACRTRRQGDGHRGRAAHPRASMRRGHLGARPRDPPPPRRRHPPRYRRSRAVATATRWPPLAQDRAATTPSSPMSSWSAPAPMPDDRLAAAAGLATDNGIVVDVHCATSDPRDLRGRRRGALSRPAWSRAPGGLAPRPGPGHASRAAMPPAPTTNTAAVPSFWSEQFDLYIQGVGCAAAKTGPPGAAAGCATMIISTSPAAHIALCRRHQCPARHGDGAAADRARYRGRSRCACRPYKAARRSCSRPSRFRSAISTLVSQAGQREACPRLRRIDDDKSQLLRTNR